jgi:hypothetical protein
MYQTRCIIDFIEIIFILDLQDEDPRPEFEASVKTFRTNPVTREKEPYMPAWQKTMRYVATSSAVLFMVWKINSIAKTFETRVT